MRQYESANTGTNLCKNIHCPRNKEHFAIVVAGNAFGTDVFHWLPIRSNR